MKTIDGTNLLWFDNRGVGEVSTFFGQDKVDGELAVKGKKETKIFLGHSVHRSHGQHGEIEYFVWQSKDGKYQVKLYND